MHLCIMTGVDNRAGILSHTIKVSRPYFSQIHIIDTGSTDHTEEVCRYLSYQRFDDWGGSWRAVYSKFLEMVPKNEYFLFLDSDEYPSQKLLDIIKDIPDKMVACKHTVGRLTGIYHRDNVPLCSPNVLPKTDVEFRKNPCFTKTIIHKNDSDLYIDNYGAHCGYTRTDWRDVYFPEYYIHYKTGLSLCTSTVLCSFMEPFGYQMGDTTSEGQAISAFREKFSIKSQNQLVRQLKNPEFEIPFRELCLSFEKSSNRAAEQYYLWATRYNFQMDNLIPNCREECCQYLEKSS